MGRMDQGAGGAMLGRTVLAAVVAAVVGGLIGFADDHDPLEAAVFAFLGVALVAIAAFKVLRESYAKGDPGTVSGVRTWAKWGAIAFALVLAGIAALLALQASRDEAGFLWRDSQVEPEPVRALKGVRLGESFADVTSRLGAFDLEAPGPAPAATGQARTYVQRGGRIRLRVEQDRVARISYECMPGDASRVNRVACEDPESRVIHVFGNGARRLCANAAKAGAQAAGAFAFDVVDTGTRYIALSGHVRGFIVMDPRELDEALGGDLLWRRCG
jgi:hypothetical protein